MTQIASMPLPTMIDWPRDEAAHDDCQWELWWITTILEAADRRLAAQAVLTHLAGGSLYAIVTITDLVTGRELTTPSFVAAPDVRLSRSVLDLQTGFCSFQGCFEAGYRLRAQLQEDAAFDLVLKPTRPVLYNGGGGTFMLQAAPTSQYSIGALDTSGRVTLDGEDIEVTGHGWHDRQWETVRRDVPADFTWFGLCLEAGDTISFWQPADGGCWVTIVRPDGTHIVAAADASPADPYATALGRRVPRRWSLSIPAVGARLAIGQKAIMDNERIYTGALDVTGSYDGKAARGFGFCDIVGTIAAAAG